MNQPPSTQHMDYKSVNKLATTEEVFKLVASNFNRLDKTSAVKLSQILLSGSEIDVPLKKFKNNTSYFIKRNKGKLEKRENPKTGAPVYYLRTDIVTNLRADVFVLLEKIGKSIVDIDDDDDNDKWAKSQIDGEYAYEVNKHTTFQNIREKLGHEGKDVSFRYSFKKPDMETTKYVNKTSLQMVDAHINDGGEHFGFPLKYTYICPECDGILYAKEYAVASTNGKIKCTEMIEKQNDKGDTVFKRCNHPLAPDDNRTETKDCYIHGISFIDENGVPQKGEAISFRPLPKGHVKVVLQKISRAYGGQFVHVVDYRPIEKNMFPIPEKVKDEHYLFTLSKTMDKYVEDNTGYYHFGYLPMKLSMFIMFAARYIPSFKNDFHMSLSGTRSSGKSQFNKYWGLGLYSHNCLSSNATSISIPKLRGTMETFRLFGKEHRYQYKGLLGEVDMIMIDEVKEDIDLKNNLKQYLLEVNYAYSKQGSNNQTYTRTAQCIVSQNLDTKHLLKYSKDIMRIYMTSELSTTNNEPKPAWDYEKDLTLPLYAYKNKYLRYAIRKVRDDYARNQVNWVDGSELALKQRFFFYYYLGTEKTNPKLTEAIRQNSIKKIVSNDVEIVQKMSAENLAEHFKNCGDIIKGTNDLEYFEKVDKILQEYEKSVDARTKTMAYAVLQLIRIIDGRNTCNEKDLEIFQYLLEAIDNKIEVADTDVFKINGPHYVDEDDVMEGEEASDTWGYKTNLDDFSK